jgi:hypothetical protein
VKELEAEFLLEPADGLGDRGLRDMQSRGGAAEVQVLGHREEVAEMTEVYAKGRRDT